MEWVIDMNELILIVSLVVIYGMVLLAFKLFGKDGLYAMSVIASVLANIEVVILISAFGLDQTLGNILFAATFLITDILSECFGKKEANRAVYLGLFTQIFFLLLSQSWLLYKPAPGDGSMEAIKAIFSNTPRMILASFSVYAVSQMFDVWLYHKWWNFTEKKFGDKKKFLWLRNNGSTLVSQLINAFLFTIVAFVGTYDWGTLMSIFGSSYVIFIFTSLLDTPIVYLARKIHLNKLKKQIVE